MLHICGSLILSGVCFQGVKQSRPKNHQQKWWAVVLSLGRHPDIQVSDVLDVINQKVDKYAIQKEVGAEGTPHFQCAFRFMKKQTKNPILEWLAESLFGGAKEPVSVEAAKAVPDLLRYCTKEDTRVEGPWVHGMDPAKLLSTRESVADLFDVRRVSYWQAFILAHCNSVVPRNDREIIWVVDRAGGTGKSALSRHLVLKRSFAVVDSARKADLAYVAGPKYRGYICDLARACKPNDEFYAGLEQLKNGCIFSAKYESTGKVFNQPYVFVFANFVPVPTAWSSDRCSLIDVDAQPEWLDDAGREFDVVFGDDKLHSNVRYNPDTGTGGLTRAELERPARVRPPAFGPVASPGFTVDSDAAAGPGGDAFRRIRIRLTAGDDGRETTVE